jgi:threonyl-tRNA synthetase
MAVHRELREVGGRAASLARSSAWRLGLVVDGTMHISSESQRMIEIRVDGSSPRRYPKGVSAREVLEDRERPALAGPIAARFNGALVDLQRSLDQDGELEGISIESPKGLEILRHSTSHVMACAVQELFPEVKVTIGPAIENGFYYDFDRQKGFTPEDLLLVEKRMEEIVSRDEPFERIVLPRDEVLRFFRQKGENYKLELLEEIPDERVSLYKLAGFTDLCRGPHLPSSRHIRAFKLTGVAGAYWRGDERQPMLQRIYGSAFPTTKELREHLELVEEAKKRDHRRLGRDLDLFSISDEVGPGLVCWHPRGAKVRTLIEDFWRQEHARSGYELLYTPHVAKIQLWETSGHTGFYKENMFSTMDVEGQNYQVKPMNCPFHIQIFKSRLRSYRELPKRWAELGTVYRYERSGVLHGLLRVRGFTQDDAHIFCRPDQLEDEIRRVIDFTLFILRTFGFDRFDVFLSTRPEKYVGTVQNWEVATEALKSALGKSQLGYTVDPGEGVFYGPKIDIKIRDSLGRQWQCSTIQVDFNLPERFDLHYVGEDGARHPVIMIHRALMGSLERFFGCLIEHYNGAFPVWLAPEQVILLPITDRAHTYAQELERVLAERGLRVASDLRNEKLGLKVREAQLAKIPYMLILGDREVQERTLSVRARSGANLPETTLEAFLERIQRDVKERRVETG